MSFLNFNAIKKYFASFSRGIVSANSDQHWMRMVLFFSIIMLGVLSFNMYIFSGIYTEKIFKEGAISAQKTNTLDQLKLRSMLDYFEKKASLTSDILKSKPAVIDPSL